MMSLIVRVVEQFLERAEAEQFVDQHLFQRELLAAVEVDLQLGEHLADDRAEFLGQLVLGERGGGFGIDALEQARKHLLLDPVDRGFEAFIAVELPCSPDCAWRSARRAIASPWSFGRALDRLLDLLDVERLGLDRRELAAALGRPLTGPGPSSAARCRSSAGRRRRSCHCVVQMHSWPRQPRLPARFPCRTW